MKLVSFFENKFVSSTDDSSDILFRTRGEVDQIFEREVILESAKYGHTGSRFIDAGANVGFFSLYLSRFFKEVLAFEPTKETFLILQENIEYNKCKNVKAIWGALGSVRSFGTLFIMGNSGGTNTLDKSVVDESVDGALSQQEVTIFRGDEFLDEIPCGLLKVDVEGMEMEVLRGFQSTIERDEPIICVEIWENRQAETISKIESEFGYVTTFPFERYPWVAFSFKK